MKNNKNQCLYSIKAICCIAVIFMHCTFPGVFGKLVSYFFKIAVPIFFMVSGYFLYNDSRETIQQKLPKKIMHILKMLVISEVFYGLYHLVILNKPFQFDGILDIIGKIFTGTFFNGTLWFLYALFWSYVLLTFINRKNLYKIVYNASPIILILHILIRTIIKQYDWYNVLLFRNALVYGLPFVLIGMYIRENQDNLLKKITNKKCLIGMFTGEIIVIIEYLITKTSLDIYIGTIITSYFIFLFAINNPNKYFSKTLKYIGEKLSMLIYIFHILTIELVTKMATNLNIYDIYIFKWLQPIIVILVSIILSYFGNKILEYVKRRSASCV